VVDTLVRDVVVVQSGHLATGNICTKYLLESLTEAHQLDVAFSIATARDYPGWGYMIENGATTIWERWENATGSGMNSHNHAMLGSISSWFYRALAGLRIEIPDDRGLRVSIRPAIPRGLRRAAAALKTVVGLVTTEWRRTDKHLELDIELPPSASAEVVFPNIASKEVVRVLLDDKCIWDANVPAASDALKPQRVSAGVSLQIGSGRYRFRVEHQFKPVQEDLPSHSVQSVSRNETRERKP
jgi:alpha-L-rhamnosidase